MGRKRLGLWGRGGTHGALEGINLAGVGLNLVSVLHHLLLGLAQRIVVLIGRLGQV